MTLIKLYTYQRPLFIQDKEIDFERSYNFRKCIKKPKKFGLWTDEENEKLYCVCRKPDDYTRYFFMSLHKPGFVPSPI